MLAMLVRALRRFPAPDALYVDNGATYTGDNLRIARERLGITLLHAKPYDSPARGKMERFWRTLRDGCLEFCGAISTLHDLNVRLIAWVDEHYHRGPHGGLLGTTPAEVFEVSPGEGDLLDEARLRIALTIRTRRRVRTDNTLSIDGHLWETTLSFLASRVVTVGQSLATPEAPPWIEHEKKAFLLQKLDPIANASRRRSPLKKTHAGASAFQPADALARKMLCRGGAR